MEREFTGKTIEEAVSEGLKELGIEESQAEITVIEEPKKGGLFGIGARNARVKIGKKLTDGQRANEFIEGLFDIMGVTATTELTEGDRSIKINVITTSSASSAVIGYRGEVLDALQCLAGAVANTGREEYSRVVVDCEGYREKREETLKSLAEKLAAKAVRTGRKVSLEPMNPFERRIIHSTLSSNTEVKTISEGKEPARYISIIPNEMKSSRPIRADRHGDRDRNDRRGNTRRNDRGRERKGGFSSISSAPVKRSGFGGTYLGNSLKDKKDKEE